MTRHALLLSDVYFPRVNGVSTSLQTFCADLADEGVVSTACLGTRSVLAEGCGADVVAEDEVQFAAAAFRVLTDPVRAHELSVRGLAWARRWASRGMASRMAALYADLAVNQTVSSAAGCPAPP
jgi:hypothetical protein